MSASRSGLWRRRFGRDDEAPSPSGPTGRDAEHGADDDQVGVVDAVGLGQGGGGQPVLVGDVAQGLAVGDRCGSPGRCRAARARRDVEPVARVDDVGVGEVVRAGDVRGVDPEGRRDPAQRLAPADLVATGFGDRGSGRIGGGEQEDDRASRPARRPRQDGIVWWSGARGWWDLPRGLRPQGASPYRSHTVNIKSNVPHQQHEPQVEGQAHLTSAEVDLGVATRRGVRRRGARGWPRACGRRSASSRPPPCGRPPRR